MVTWHTELREALGTVMAPGIADFCSADLSPRYRSPATSLCASKQRQDTTSAVITRSIGSSNPCHHNTKDGNTSNTKGECRHALQCCVRHACGRECATGLALQATAMSRCGLPTRGLMTLSASGSGGAAPC